MLNINPNTLLMTKAKKQLSFYQSKNTKRLIQRLED